MHKLTASLAPLSMPAAVRGAILDKVLNAAARPTKKPAKLPLRWEQKIADVLAKGDFHGLGRDAAGVWASQYVKHSGEPGYTLTGRGAVTGTCTCVSFARSGAARCCKHIGAHDKEIQESEQMKMDKQERETEAIRQVQAATPGREDMRAPRVVVCPQCGGRAVDRLTQRAGTGGYYLHDVTCVDCPRKVVV